MIARNGSFAALRLLRAVPLFFLIALTLNAQEQTHTLKKGETIYALAKMYGVKQDEILFLNGIEDASRVYVGQKIRIPAGSIEVSPIPSGAPSFVEHKVARGETLFGIARLYNVKVDQLRSVNNLSENYVLKIGDTLRVPSVSASSALPPVAAAPQAARPAASAGSASSASSASTTSRAVDRSLVWPIAVKEAAYMTGKLSGVVLTGEQGESVRCIAEGTVVSSGPYRGFGRVVIVQTKDGHLYVYGGLESLSAKEGDKVTSSAELGKLGRDAASGKNDLYFMVYKSNNPVDPARAPRS